MAVRPGRHRLGRDRGRIILHTFRNGLAAQAGHDLTIEVDRWSGELTVNDDLTPADVEIRIDLGSLIVRKGTGGLKPLTDRDRCEIAVTARKVLAADRHAEATFAAATFEPSGGGGAVSGTLALHGATRPVKLQVVETAAGRYHATASVVQSEFGIKPYTAFLGALRLRDAVDVEIDIDLSELEAPPGARS